VKADNSPARGMRDLLPADVATRDHVLHAITSTYRTFGYQRIETPALEDINRLQGGQGGENEKLIYQILRRGLPETTEADAPIRDLVDLGLRFDLTVPLTRFYGNNHATLPTHRSGPCRSDLSGAPNAPRRAATGSSASATST